MTYRGGDSTNANDLPVGLDAYAGYINGRYADYVEIAERFPSAHLLDISVYWSNVGTVLDIERFDATPAEAPVWVNERIAAGVYRPVLYCSVSLMPSIVALMNNASIPRASYRIWTAHYGAGQHICNGADGTQWVDWGGWDESLFGDTFFANPGPVTIDSPPLICLPTETIWENVNSMQQLVNVPLDGSGDGWSQTVVPWNQLISVFSQPGYPPRDGYARGSVGAVNQNGDVCVVVTGGNPGTVLTTWVSYNAGS